MAKQRIIPIVYKVDYTQVDKSTASVKKAEQATDKLNKEIKETGDAGTKSFGNLKNAILATGIIGIVGTLGKKIFDLGVAQEQTNIAFNTFLGSAAKGKALLQELTKFSIVTPFSPEQVNKAAKSLLAFGVEGKKIIPTLKLLGDVSSGTGKDLSEMAIIFGQIRSTGRLMGQDLLQLINAGFNPLQIISQKTGKSVGELKAEMEKGLITFDMVEGAFRDATSEGGLFFNLMEKQSQTIGGIMSTISGNIEEGFKNIFSAGSGPLKEFVDRLNTLSLAFLEFTKSQEQVRDEIKSSITEKEIENFAQFAKGYKNNTEALEAYKLELKKTQEFIDAQYSLTVERQMQNQITWTDRIKGTVQEKERLHNTLEATRKRLGAEHDAYQDEVIPAIEEYIKSLEDVTTTETKLAVKRNKNREEFLRMMGFTTAAEKVKQAEKDAEIQDKIESDANDRSQKNQDYFDDLRAKKLQQQKDYEYEIAEQAAEKRIKLEKDLAAKIEELEGQLSEALIDFGTEVFIDSAIGREQDFEKQEEYYDEQLRLAGDNDKAKEQIELKREAARQKFEKAQKERQKKEARARIGIETAVAIIKTFSQFGYPAGIIPAALMAATGIVQMATVGKYKDGVIDLKGPGTGTSDSIPSLLSRGESVMTAKETDSSNGILKAIRAKKLDDRVIEKLYKRGQTGGDGVAFSDKRIVEAIKGQRPTDVVKIGSYVYDVRQKNRDHKNFVRRKYIS